MAPSRERRIAAGVAIAGLLLLGFATWQLILRVQKFHHESPRLIYAFQTVDARAFTFAGRDVTLEDDISVADAPKMHLTYGDQSVLLDVAIPPRHNLPGLKGHEDWLRVLRFVLRSGLTNEEFAAKLDAGADRLVLVTRTPPAGVDPATWGTVWKTAWVFDFYELLPDATIEHQTLAYPTTRDIAKPKEGELQENTWEFQAALQLMPNAGQAGPTHNFYGDALAAAGIMLPLAAFSGLAAALGLVFMFAPKRRTE